MKKIMIFCWLCFVISFACLAQEDQFKAGMQSYEDKNYLNAIILFGKALDEKYLMNGKDLPKAYLYRAKSIMRVYDQSIANTDTFMLSRFPDMLVVAYEDLKEAEKFDGGKIQDEIKETFEGLGQVTIRFCQIVARQLRLDFQNKHEVDSLLGVIRNELVLLEKHQFKNRNYLDLLGLVEYKSKNYELAESYFNEAQSMSQEDATVTIDIDHIYSYYYGGWIKYHETHDFETALADVEEAKRRLSLYQDSQNDVDQKDSSNLGNKLKDLEFRLKLLVN